LKLEEKLTAFIRSKYEKALSIAARDGKPLEIEFKDLDKHDPKIADDLLQKPKEVLDALKKAIESFDIENVDRVYPRIKKIPESQNIRIRNLRSEHLGKFVTLEGIVKTASEVKPQIFEAIFECPDCGAEIPIVQTEHTLRYPSICDCGRKGRFRLKDKKLFDSRWLKISEPFEVATSEKPGEISVYLKEDLTTPPMQRKTDPGARLKINGILREREIRVSGKLSTQIDTFLEANYVESMEMEFEDIVISKEDEKKIKELAKKKDVYKKLSNSISPSIYGFDEVKEAILMQMFGGCQHKLPDGTMIRGDIHILLTGDPSVGKTQLLKLVSKSLPRGKYVSGKGVSAAGLTATVRKEEEFMGGWVLEAGALVLCNKGVICIDEFDKMSPEDQVAMHEALSTQTISIAKASIVATLPAQTAVLAGANPKLGRFDQYVSIVQQIDIPETLLSRFDLKFALRDIPSEEQDKKLAEHVLISRINPKKIEPEISPEFIRKYVLYVKKLDLKPKLTEKSSNLIKDFYVKMRNMYSDEETPTVAITLRQYEALIRLAEASAKIRLSNKISEDDAKRAIRLMTYSLKQLGYDVESGKIDIDKIESGITTKQRSKIRIVLDVVEKLESDLAGKEIPIDDVLAAVVEEGVDERTAEEIIQRLKNQGMLFEPRAGFLRKV